jgi:hypothetical protein
MRDVRTLLPDRSVRRPAVSLILVIAALLGPRTTWAQLPEPAEDLAARRIADRARAQSLAPDAAPPADATNAQVLSSLGLTSAHAPSIARTGAAAALGVFANLGAVRPLAGTSLLALSTGMAGSTAPQPGTDFSPSGVAGDRATLAVTFTVPEGMTRLVFLYRFMSAEYPEYVGSIYNDGLSISVVRGGVREEVSRSSVNSALFEGASSANAGGTGYEVYIGQQPTGGLTRWIPVRVPVTPGPMTLEISIEDVGDGIYDSQVLVSRLGLGAIETLDPNPALLQGAGLTSDVNLLATAGRPVRGLTADGASRLLLRVAPTDAARVRLTVIGGPGDGGLTPRQGGTPQSSVEVDVVNTSAGPHAFALYHPPEEFGAANLAERTVRVSATFLGGEDDGSAEQEIVLARPAILLVHGFRSDHDGAFGSAPLKTDPRFAGRIHGPTYASTAAMATTYTGYGQWVNSALKQLRDSGLAATRVDVVSHSMGGLLARKYAAEFAQYRRPQNFDLGDFNRVITVNTPHRGSPLADLAVRILENPIVGPALQFILEQYDYPYGQAYHDLRERSSAVQQIPRADVRGRALAGTGGSDFVEAAGAVGTIADLVAYLPQPPASKIFFESLAFSAATLEDANTVIFGHRQHDAVVPIESQIGGMPTARTRIFGGLDSLHWNAVPSMAYTEELVASLNTPPSSAAFGSFPARGGNPATDMLPDVPFVAYDPPPIGLTVAASPLQAAPGGAITVTVTPRDGFTATRVMAAGPGVSAFDAAPPFALQLVVPANHIGPFKIGAVGLQANGSYIGSNEVVVQVTTTAALTGLTVEPGQVLMTAIGATERLTITGQYADGVSRVLNDTGLVTFSSSNSGVATVDTAGVVTARGLGYATLRAVSGSRQVSVSVTVNPHAALPPPRANAGHDQGVTPGTLVTLAGQALGVPAGLTPTYAWAQVSGPATLGLSSLTVPAPTFTAGVAGTYVLSLIVRAGLSESAPDNVTVVVGSASAPVVNVPPGNLQVRQGETASFSVAATAIPTPTYAWRKNGSPVAGANAPTLTIANAQPSDGGAYSVVIANPSGSVTAGPAQLTVCAYAIGPTAIDVPGTGGSGSLTITTAAGCQWTATSSAGWLAVSGSAGGSGSGAVTWTAAASTLPSSRTASLSIGGVVVTVTQLPGVTMSIPGPPENLVASQNGALVTLAWDPPAFGQSPVRYVIETSTAEGRNDLPPRPTAGVQTFHAMTISSGAFYIRVRAVSAGGQSGPSNEVRVSFGGGPAVPAAPGSLTAVVSGSTVTLQWLAPRAGHPATGYVLEAGTGLGRSDIIVFNTGSSQPAFRTAGVPPGVYYIRVRGRNSTGAGEPSNELVLRVGQASCTATPEPPVMLSPTLRDAVVGLSWLPPPTGTPRSYVLLAGKAPGVPDLASFDTGSATTSFGAPVPAGTYYVRAIARTACGDSQPSNEVMFTVGQAIGPPGRAVGLTATKGAGGLVMLNWFPPATGGPPSSYMVQAGSAPGQANLAVVLTGLTATTFSTVGVPRGTYYVRVLAVNAAGVGSPSNEVTLTVP